MRLWGLLRPVRIQNQFNLPEHRTGMDFSRSHNLYQTLGRCVIFVGLTEFLPQCRATVNMPLGSENGANILDVSDDLHVTEFLEIRRQSILKILASFTTMLLYPTGFTIIQVEHFESKAGVRAVINCPKYETATATSSAQAHGTFWKKSRLAAFPWNDRIPEPTEHGI